MENQNQQKPSQIKKCGIIMPISGVDDFYTEEHWRNVYSIFQEIISDLGFEPNIVSHGHKYPVIHTRIIDSLYNNEMVVCDVSAKKPNVILELGWRLAFGKPVIIIKDDKTKIDFDLAPNEHIEYPSNFDKFKLNGFTQKLSEAINETYKKVEDGTYISFMHSLGPYKRIDLDSSNTGLKNYLYESFEDLKGFIISHFQGSHTSESENKNPPLNLIIPIDKLWQLNHWGNKYATIIDGKIIFSGKNGPEDGCNIDIIDQLNIGDTYEVSCFAKSELETNGEVSLWCHDKSTIPNGVSIQTSFITPKVDGERISLKFNARYNKNIRVHIQYKPGQGSIEVSDFRISEL